MAFKPMIHMYYVGIDDTDTRDTRGTNQLARALMRRVASRFRCLQIVRHQLLQDPRVPFTSKNGSASLLFEPWTDAGMPELIDELRQGMLHDFIPGSDPGLCVTDHVPDEVVAWGRRCQTELVTRGDALALAANCGIYLEGLGGTQDGIIGALAAVGLAFEGNDGRVVQVGSWPDDLCGWQDVRALAERGIKVQLYDTAEPIDIGRVDVGKHLRSNLRNGRHVLFVTLVGHSPAHYQAIKLT